MSDGLQLIHSNGNGDPLRGGAYLHWVRVTSNLHPAPVNQLTDDGKYPHADCGEASIRSSLYDRKINADVLTIEHDAGASSQGTTAAGLVRALHDLGLAASAGNGTLAAGVVMNPLGGRVFPASDFGAYAAASAGEFVSISTPGVWDNTDDMSAQAEAQIADIWTALFGPAAVNGGEGPAKPNNLDIIRRKLSPYAQPYPAANGAEIVTTGVALTAAEIAQLAQIPTILALLEKIDAALHSA
jgi:hypothetical protein